MYTMRTYSSHLCRVRWSLELVADPVRDPQQRLLRRVGRGDAVRGAGLRVVAAAAAVPAGDDGGKQLAGLFLHQTKKRGVVCVWGVVGGGGLLGCV